MKKPLVKVDVVDASSKSSKNNSRRKFIKLSGLGIAGSSFLLYGCSEDDMFDPGGDQGGNPMEPEEPEEPQEPEAFDLGPGNLGILNYAYALEQLEAEFYTRMTAGAYYMGLADDSDEKQILEDTWYHEVIHREFFRTAITAAAPDGILPDLEFDFSSVNFDDRQSVLDTALLLEDTGVSAYNGAGKLIDVDAELGGTYLLLAGKIVSVEARHASAFADLALGTPTAFARDEVLVSIEGVGPAFDKATPPADVLAAAGGFITTEFTANQLPTE
ncbi:ferritin-like domain-containing protein [Gramella sp. MAR_2010_147]|uniref:ferritin-like domain-containing protein n=1 Tax=Gramella sp. MAR_2010_147 TaxID=1250205 RepID=UPI000879D957|nr:ferritin-like domain-containing protein [Gramella sp. MAR_2010_147]SDR95771.1 Ferritin-like domain-containing protein [Gramella sp. MAR_2010_147]